jgi:RNA polymerase sigma-70 factor (ECF subfamily)
MSDFIDALASQIPRLRRYARALTHDVAWADDLVQDTLERALQRRWMFRLNTNLIAWLFTLLYRLYLNDAGRRRRLAPATGEALPEASVSEDVGLRLDMQRALARLSEEQRAVIVLIGLEQLSYQEAAEVLDIPLGTVMSRLKRARDQLHRLMNEPAQPSADANGRLTRIK